MAGYSDDFIGWVEMHEHNWSDEPYPNRPKLDDILRSPVVTFWKPAKQDKPTRYHVRLFADLRAVENLYTKQMMRPHTEAEPDRLVRIYANKKQMIIASVKMEFQEIKPGK